MPPTRAVSTFVWTLGLLMPAGAEIYRVVNAERPAEFIDVDCAQSPAGRTFPWVASNYRLAPSAVAPIRKVTVRGWDPQKKEAFVGVP
jgi:hypothetical protein